MMRAASDSEWDARDKDQAVSGGEQDGKAAEPWGISETRHFCALGGWLDKMPDHVPTLSKSKH